MRKSVSVETLSTMVGMWETHTIIEIAKSMDVTENTIARWASSLRKRGIDLPRKKKESAFDQFVREYTT